MIIVKKSALLSRPAMTLYGLVATIERYPEFLPWCSGAKILTASETKTVATLQIHYLGVHSSFTTANDNKPFSSITFRLVDGPFKKLEGKWSFTALTDEACKVELDLHYEFSSVVLSKLIGPAFQHIANNLVAAFVVRAEQG